MFLTLMSTIAVAISVKAVLNFLLVVALLTLAVLILFLLCKAVGFVIPNNILQVLGIILLLIVLLLFFTGNGLTLV